MAVIYVKNAEVTRVFEFAGGQGVGLKEAFTKNNGEQGARYYSAFFTEPHGLELGDVGDFNGLLGTKVREYEKDGEVRHSADVTLNNTKVTLREADEEDPFA